MDEKYCPVCKSHVPIDRFGKNKHHKDGLQSKCKKCDTAYHIDHYQANKEKYKANAKKSRERKQRWFNEIKRSLRCAVCGDTRWYCLDFHHDDPGSKDSEVAAMATHRSKKAVLEEITKCTVLCANCHREKHYKEKYGDVAEMD